MPCIDGRGRRGTSAPQRSCRLLSCACASPNAKNNHPARAPPPRPAGIAPTGRDNTDTLQTPQQNLWAAPRFWRTAPWAARRPFAGTGLQTEIRSPPYTHLPPAQTAPTTAQRRCKYIPPHRLACARSCALPHGTASRKPGCGRYAHMFPPRPAR